MLGLLLHQLRPLAVFVSSLAPVLCFCFSGGLGGGSVVIWETGVLFQKAVSHGGAGVRCVFETVVVFQETGGEGGPRFSETTISKN